jgi:hypothetical protein
MPSKQIVLLLAAFVFALAAVALAGPAAQAFTAGAQGSTSVDGSSQFVDPDERVANFGGANGSAQQLPSGPSHQADGQRPGQQHDLSGPLFRSLKSPIVGNGGYR